MLKPTLRAAAMAVAFSCAAPAGLAEEIVVRMLDESPNGKMVFEPAAADLKVGDTVRFVPAHPGHNVESIKTMLPAGAQPVRSPLGKEVTVTFDRAGVYGLKCAPHYGMGMVFLAKVGEAELSQARAAAEKTPPRVKKRFIEAFDRLDRG